MTANEQFNIEVVIPSIGAIIRNVDLSQPLTSDRKHALEQALYKHHVLFFPDQNLTPEQQRDFALQFGSIHVHPITKHTRLCPEVTVLEFGEDVNPNERTRADRWHTDVTWSPNPPIIGMLYAKVIPKHGGDTLWTSMVDIYKEELSTEMKHILSNLTAEHSLEIAFKPRINSDSAYIETYTKAKENNPPVSHPVICEHPHTKEKYLYVNGNFTTKINELNEHESDLLLKYLLSLVTKRPEFMCRWKWSENDVCIWDERTTQHYGTGDYRPQHRKMHRCAITEREDNNSLLQ